MSNERKPSPIPIDDVDILGSTKGPAIILWAIRKHQPLTLGKLFEVVWAGDMDKKSKRRVSTESQGVNIGAASRLMVNSVQQLIEAGLVVVDGELPPASASNMGLVQMLQSKATLRISDKWPLVQEIFGISLTELTTGSIDHLTINPAFGDPHEGQWPDVFVIMPFRDDLKPVYYNTIQPVLKGLNLTSKRGDDFFSDNIIIDEIWSAVYFSRLCIADCTGYNPNVFYEIGMAHTLGRPCILLTQNLIDMPFDVRDRRFILYQNTPEGLETMKENLLKAIQSELNIDTSTPDVMTKIYKKLG